MWYVLWCVSIVSDVTDTEIGEMAHMQHAGGIWHEQQHDTFYVCSMLCNKYLPILCNQDWACYLY